MKVLMGWGFSLVLFQGWTSKSELTEANCPDCAVGKWRCNNLPYPCTVQGRTVEHIFDFEYFHDVACVEEIVLDVATMAIDRDIYCAVAEGIIPPFFANLECADMRSFDFTGIAAFDRCDAQGLADKLLREECDWFCKNSRPVMRCKYEFDRSGLFALQDGLMDYCESSGECASTSSWHRTVLCKRRPNLLGATDAELAAERLRHAKSSALLQDLKRNMGNHSDPLLSTSDALEGEKREHGYTKAALAIQLNTLKSANNKTKAVLMILEKEEVARNSTHAELVVVKKEARNVSRVHEDAVLRQEFLKGNSERTKMKIEERQRLIEETQTKVDRKRTEWHDEEVTSNIYMAIAFFLGFGVLAGVAGIVRTWNLSPSTDFEKLAIELRNQNESASDEEAVVIGRVLDAAPAVHNGAAPAALENESETPWLMASHRGLMAETELHNITVDGTVVVVGRPVSSDDPDVPNAMGTPVTTAKREVSPSGTDRATSKEDKKVQGDPNKQKQGLKKSKVTVSGNPKDSGGLKQRKASLGAAGKIDSTAKEVTSKEPAKKNSAPEMSSVARTKPVSHDDNFRSAGRHSAMASSPVCSLPQVEQEEKRDALLSPNSSPKPLLSPTAEGIMSQGDMHQAFDSHGMSSPSSIGSPVRKPLLSSDTSSMVMSHADLAMHRASQQAWDSHAISSPSSMGSPVRKPLLSPTAQDSVSYGDMQQASTPGLENHAMSSPSYGDMHQAFDSHGMSSPSSMGSPARKPLLPSTAEDTTSQGDTRPASLQANQSELQQVSEQALDDHIERKSSEIRRAELKARRSAARVAAKNTKKVEADPGRGPRRQSLPTMNSTGSKSTEVAKVRKGGRRATAASTCIGQSQPVLTGSAPNETPQEMPQTTSPFQEEEEEDLLGIGVDRDADEEVPPWEPVLIGSAPNETPKEMPQTTSPFQEEDEEDLLGFVVDREADEEVPPWEQFSAAAAGVWPVSEPAAPMSIEANDSSAASSAGTDAIDRTSGAASARRSGVLGVDHLSSEDGAEDGTQLSASARRSGVLGVDHLSTEDNVQLAQEDRTCSASARRSGVLGVDHLNTEDGSQPPAGSPQTRRSAVSGAEHLNSNSDDSEDLEHVFDMDSESNSEVIGADLKAK